MSYTLTTKKSWSQTQRELGEEFQRWGVSDWDTNYPRGASREGFSQTDEERTVTLRYVKKGKTVNLYMGKQSRAVDNLRVLYLAVESMRLNEKRGIGDILESAYIQIAGPAPEPDPYHVLGIQKWATLEMAESVYRFMASKYHPDSKPSGDVDKFKQITRAIEQIREERK
jgi:hypothetical protein